MAAWTWWWAIRPTCARSLWALPMASLRDRLRSRYAATSHGEWDLYAAFLEQGLRWLRDDGELGIVVPSRWWTASWAGPLRAALADRGSVAALVDFGAVQIFSDATVYASLCFASRREATQVQVARACGSTWELGEVPTSTLHGTGAWDLSVGASREIVNQLRGQGGRLGQIARIAKGTGTNADSVFIIPDSSFGIESALLHAVLRGRDVRSMGAVPAWPRLLVPYDAEGHLISAAEMKRRYPRAFAYLAGHRTRLEARERGRFAGESFYCFGRPQNLQFLRDTSPKVVVPDVTREGRALLDTGATMVLDSAYAIRLGPNADIDHATLCGLLNSRLVRLWLDTQGIPLRGGYTRMKTAYLRELPLPKASAATGEIGALVRAAARSPRSMRRCDAPLESPKPAGTMVVRWAPNNSSQLQSVKIPALVPRMRNVSTATRFVPRRSRPCPRLWRW